MSILGREVILEPEYSNPQTLSAGKVNDETSFNPPSALQASMGIFSSIEKIIVTLVPPSIRPITRCVIAELIGTFILGTLIHCSVYSLTDEKGRFHRAEAIIAILLCVFTALVPAIPVSGGHINPVVTLASMIVGHFPSSWVIPYILAQTIGGFLSMAVFRSYFLSTGKEEFTPFGKTPEVGFPRLAIASFWGTGFFAFGLASLIQKKSFMAQPKFIWPLSAGMILAPAVMAFSPDGIPNLNPGLDFGGRLFMVMMGDGNAFAGWTWLLNGIVCPIIGGVLGLMSYRLVMGSFFTDQEIPVGF